MAKIHTGYELLASDTRLGLEEQVDEALEHGLDLYGHPFFDGVEYVQAVVNYKIDRNVEVHQLA